MYQDDPGLEQRFSRFEAQLDRFSLALHQWQAKDQPPSPAAPDIETRIKTLEETLDREAHALRQLHEEPLKQLQAQAARLQDLSRTLQALVRELQGGAARNVSPQGSTAAWPLERVVHLHDELRRGDNSDTSPVSTQERRGTGTRVFHAVADDPQATPGGLDRFRSLLTRKYVVGAVIGVTALTFTAVMVRWIESRLNDASARVVAAEKQVAATTRLANEEVTSARQAADRQIAEARQLAQRAETVGTILTAPDLIRFNLTSTAEDGSSALLLWSRTRGLVLSGSRLPSAPPESTYQLWLVTSTQSFGAGLFVPDAAGRANLVIDAPPTVAGRVVGAAVTIEPTGGRLTPSGRTLLARFP